MTLFSERLADAGYRNGYFGKWHVEQSQQLERFGWYEYDLDCAGQRGDLVPGSEIVLRSEGYRDTLMAAVQEDVTSVSHPAFDAGIDFIRRSVSENENEDAPFCCFISTFEPHDPYIPPQRFLDLYDVDSIQLSPTLKADLVNKPEVLARMRNVWRDFDDDDWRAITAAYWASISFIDRPGGPRRGVDR